MERKIQRESTKYIEKQFKKHDPKGTGSIPASAMESIIRGLCPFDEEELKEMIDANLGEATYLVPNKTTRQFDRISDGFKLDFPSVMAIAVHFLKKQERRNTNEFSSKGLIRLSDLPSFSDLQAQMAMKHNRKLY